LFVGDNNQRGYTSVLPFHRRQGPTPHADCQRASDENFQHGSSSSVVLTGRRISSLQQNRTYFSELAGRGWLLVGLFALVFYFLCFLYSKRHITAGEGGVLLGTYWATSTLYFSKEIYDGFPRFYRATLRRMRLYSSVRRFIQWYLGFLFVGTTGGSACRYLRQAQIPDRR
jgi:hypothetical protein